jgi:hypothetical protein
LQARADVHSNSNIRRGRPRKVVTILRRYIERSLRVSRPLILLFQFLQPSPNVHSWFPGMGERITVMNAAIGALVAEIDDPAVRVFDLPALVDRRLPEGEEPTPEDFITPPRCTASSARS